MDHPEELSKVAGLQKKVEEVKGIMVDNIDQVPWPSFRIPHGSYIQLGLKRLGLASCLNASFECADASTRRAV